MLPAVAEIAAPVAGEQASQHQGIGKERWCCFLGQAGLPRDLDGHLTTIQQPGAVHLGQ